MVQTMNERVKERNCQMDRLISYVFGLAKRKRLHNFMFHFPSFTSTCIHALDAV